MSSPTNLEAVQAILQAERVLDDPPSEYRVKTLHVDFDLGTASTLREHYNKNLLDVPGKIITGGAEIKTTPEVMAVLRALLYTGCCRIEARSNACREIFTRACRVGSYIGTEELLSSFVEKDSNKFVAVIQDAIKDLLGSA